MKSVQRSEKIEELKKEMKILEERMKLTLRKSDEAFNLGGDGWHDNSAYHLMISEVDKIGAMMDEIKEELKELSK